jgi:hypothetical protein
MSIKRHTRYKNIEDKKAYLRHNYPFSPIPKLQDHKECIHCGESILVNDFKVIIEEGVEYIVCPNHPKCDGTVIDWIDSRENNKLDDLQDFLPQD